MNAQFGSKKRVWVWSLIVVLGCLHGTASAALVAHFKLDEGAGATVADTVTANTGSISGAAWTAGIYGNGLSFDGTDDLVDVAFNGSYLVSQGTVMAWVKPSSTSGNGTAFAAGVEAYGTIPGWNDPYTGLQIGAGQTARKVIGFTNYGVGFHTNQGTADNVLTNDAWNHVATTNDGTTLRVFLNGVELASNSVSGAIQYFNSPHMVIGGRSVVGPGEYFGGLIDEVKLFDTALTASEIQSAMQVPEPTSLTLFGAGLAGLFAVVRRRRYSRNETRR